MSPIEQEQKERDKRYKDRSKLRNKIERDLIEQLGKNSKHSHFKDLVSDYISLWDIKSELIIDIKEKGVSIKYQNGKNQFGYKKNDSVKELTSVNSQMLKILTDLNIKIEEVKEKEEPFEL